MTVTRHLEATLDFPDDAAAERFRMYFDHLLTLCVDDGLVSDFGLALGPTREDEHSKCDEGCAEGHTYKRGCAMPAPFVASDPSSWRYDVEKVVGKPHA